MRESSRSVSCFLDGSEGLRRDLADRLGPEVRVVHAPCMGRCDRAPVAVVGRHHVDRATVGSVARAVEEGRIESVLPGETKAFEDYVLGDDGQAVLKDDGFLAP